jgi:uncharacterized repeat protein (TIGR03803 family)
LINLLAPETALKQIPNRNSDGTSLAAARRRRLQGGKNMRIIYRSMAITLAALSLTGSALAAPGETVLYGFNVDSNGYAPVASLIADNQGALYGTTAGRGATLRGTGYGTVFKLTPPAKGQMAWTETVLYSFTGGSDGFYPLAGLIADKEGALYGTTQAGGTAGFGTVFKLTPPVKGQTAWTKTALYSFCLLSNCSDGQNPVAGLSADNQGSLYGTTIVGGSSSGQCGVLGCGTVFKLTPPVKGQTAWTETVLYRFCSLSNCTDGFGPSAGLIPDKKGSLYSTTQSGGSGYGTVFKLTPPPKGQTAWIASVLYSFKGGVGDGENSTAGLIADNGALYGTTVGGGAGGNGTVFKLTPPNTGQTAWTETVLHTFCSQSYPCGGDGARPLAGLIADKEGALYGTTQGGGTDGGIGNGTVFKLTPPAKGQTAWTETMLYRFAGGSDGANPYAGLTADKRGGALYGTTFYGGGSNSVGTVFKQTLR